MGPRPADLRARAPSPENKNTCRSQSLQPFPNTGWHRRTVDVTKDGRRRRKERDACVACRTRDVVGRLHTSMETPRPAAAPKVSVKVRVVADTRVVGDWGKLYNESIKVNIGDRRLVHREGRCAGREQLRGWLSAVASGAVVDDSIRFSGCFGQRRGRRRRELQRAGRHGLRWVARRACRPLRAACPRPDSSDGESAMPCIDTPPCAMGARHR